jgi:hypothetical protein
MAQTPNIITPKEVALDSKGAFQRTWYRFFDSLSSLSGKLAKPITVAGGSILTTGALDSGSTLSIANSPPKTLLGNSQTTEAQPTPQTVDLSSLSFQNGTLAAVSLPAQTLAGNASLGSAPAGAINVGPGLVLDSTTRTLSASGGGGGGTSGAGLALIETVAFWGM